jgi:hypothetical protein
MGKKNLNDLKDEIKDWKDRNSGSEKKRFDELENIIEYWKDVDSGLSESLIFLATETINLRRMVNQHDNEINYLYGINLWMPLPKPPED